MIKKIILTILLAVCFRYFMAIRKGLCIGKEFLYKHAPGPCRQIYKEGGAEDVTHIGDGLVLVSSGVNLLGNKGNIKLLDLNPKDPTLLTLKITNPPKDRPDFMTSPHGISTWRDPDSGDLRLYVVTHPPTEDVIEVFELERDHSLKHIRSISDPAFQYTNDLAVVGKDQFYITRMMHFRTMMGWYVDFLMTTWGKVFYYDGDSAKLVWSGMYKPNGINVSPDKRTVYVAEVGKMTLWAFERNADNSLSKKWTHYMDAGIDNIEVDQETGDLWTGSHPLFYMTYDLYGIFNFTLPGQVLKVKLDQGQVKEVIEVYADDGSEITFTSSATLVNNKRLVIGSVTSQLVVCDVEYIK